MLVALNSMWGCRRSGGEGVCRIRRPLEACWTLGCTRNVHDKRYIFHLTALRAVRAALTHTRHLLTMLRKGYRCLGERVHIGRRRTHRHRGLVQCVRHRKVMSHKKNPAVKTKNRKGSSVLGLNPAWCLCIDMQTAAKGVGHWQNQSQDFTGAGYCLSGIWLHEAFLLRKKRRKRRNFR